MHDFKIFAVTLYRFHFWLASFLLSWSWKQTRFIQCPWFCFWTICNSCFFSNSICNKAFVSVYFFWPRTLIVCLLNDFSKDTLGRNQWHVHFFVGQVNHLFWGSFFFTRNEIFLLLRNESAHDDKSCKLEKDCLSVNIVKFPHTINWYVELFCM